LARDISSKKLHEEFPSTIFPGKTKEARIKLKERAIEAFATLFKRIRATFYPDSILVNHDYDILNGLSKWDDWYDKSKRVY
jgi:hypothetical protein